jgi:hypothetical protein
MNTDVRIFVAIVSALGLAVALYALWIVRRPRRAVMRRMAASLAPLLGNELKPFVRTYVPLYIFLAGMSLLGIAVSIQGHAGGSVGVAGVLGIILLAINFLVARYSPWAMQVPRHFRGMTESDLVEWFGSRS